MVIAVRDVYYLKKDACEPIRTVGSTQWTLERAAVASMGMLVFVFPNHLHVSSAALWGALNTICDKHGLI